MINRRNNQQNTPESTFYGTAIVGTKGQIVIPKEARDNFKIKAKDKLIIFGSDKGVIAIVKADMLDDLLASITDASFLGKKK